MYLGRSNVAQFYTLYYLVINSGLLGGAVCKYARIDVWCVDLLVELKQLHVSSHSLQ